MYGFARCHTFLITFTRLNPSLTLCKPLSYTT
nr:MAG TPA_asm: hypothetical protein [Caudoviricetes sp.]